MALLARVQKAQKVSFKQVVNETLRQGLACIAAPSLSRAPFHTRTVALGRCLVGTIDDVAEVRAVAERGSFP